MHEGVLLCVCVCVLLCKRVCEKVCSFCVVVIEAEKAFAENGRYQPTNENKPIFEIKKRLFQEWS